MLQIKIIDRNSFVPSEGKSTAYLRVDHWNDYSFVTMFELSIHDQDGELHDIGAIKIGFVGQDESKSTHSTLETSFQKLPDNYFSLGLDVEYYEKIRSLNPSLKEDILNSLNDMVFNHNYLDMAQEEEVFSVSLLRHTSLSVIKGQYKRVLEGSARLTDFDFSFKRPHHKSFSEVDLTFKVEADSQPSTNIHALIGRNGVGKTTLLNDMINAIIRPHDTISEFYENDYFDQKAIKRDYFSSLVSVSFSAFDPFIPPKEQSDPAKGACYFYIGLKSFKKEGEHRTIPDLYEDCVRALIDCFSHKSKTKRWQSAIEKLGSDENFSSMQLVKLLDTFRDLQRENSRPPNGWDQSYLKEITPYLKKMSSGHAVVLLVISKLVATVEEKTLILMDEPESHLHPPLLSAFLRALSDLLHERNGLAIIATHSPVVLQEVPQSCVWKLHRIGAASKMLRPNIETFGENVGVLTREVFGLEVSKSGFHELLKESVNTGKSYNQILQDYKNQLGVEGRAILKTLVVHRDKVTKND